MKQFLIFRLQVRSRPLWLFSALIVMFSAQQLVISNPFSPIKLYMPVVIMLGIFLFIQSWTVSKSNYYKAGSIDVAIGLVYTYSLFSSLWADNQFLALRMVIGIFILLFAYLVLRITLSKLTVFELKATCVQASKLFVVLSFSYYIAGLLQHFVIGVPLVMTEGAHVAYMHGVFFEGGIIPRLRGVCESPNNFGLYAVFFLSSLFLSDKVSKLYVTSLIIMMVLTLSFTTYIAMFLMLIVFLIKQYGIKLTLRYGAVAVCLLIMLIMNGEFLEGVLMLNSDSFQRLLTGSGRWELFTFSLERFLDSPLFGYGLNQAREVLEPLRHVRSTHNNFIETLLEGGMIGGGYIYVALSCYRLKHGRLDMIAS